MEFGGSEKFLKVIEGQFSSSCADEGSKILEKLINTKDQDRLQLISGIALKYIEEGGRLPRECDFIGQKLDSFGYKFLASLFKAFKNRSSQNESGDLSTVVITRETVGESTLLVQQVVSRIAGLMEGSTNQSDYKFVIYQEDVAKLAFLAF